MSVLRTTILLLILLLLLAMRVSAQQLAFPSAEGFGRFASGGRGGVVYKVNNVATFRAAMETTGARTIVFTAGGTYDFHTDAIGDGGSPVGDNLTVACQTAPGDGVLLKGEIKLPATKNVIMRHCRIRPGDQPDTSTETTNALGGFVGPPHATVSYYNIYDHMSLGSSNDDIAGHYNHGTVDAFVTVQNSIISESVGGVLGGEVSRGFTTGGTLQNKISFINNVFADFNKRAPSFQGGTLQFVNNVTHWINCCEATYLQPLYGPVVAHIENNWFGARSCCTTETRINIVGCGYSGWTSNCNTAHDNASNIYVHGNTHTLARPSASTGSETAMVSLFSGVNIMNTKVQSTTPIAGMPALPGLVDSVAARTRIINTAGVRSHPLDSFDQRVINDVINDTGRRCDGTGESACLTFGSYATGTAPTDTDNDGIPDTWETAHGLNPASAADGPALHANGYSNLENYINDLAGDAFDEDDEEPGGGTVGDVQVCIKDFTWPITQPTTATCDFAMGTPKAALVFASRSVTTGTVADGGGFSVGAFDGTRQWGATVTALDVSAVWDASRTMATDEMAMFLGTAAAVDGEYNATAFVTDGITWASGNTLAATARGKVVFFGGADLSAYAGTFLASATIGGTQTVSVLPFKPDVVLLTSVNVTTFDTPATNSFICLGAAIQVADVITQGSIAQSAGNGGANGNMGGLVEDRYGCALTAAGSLLQAVEITSVTSTGFVATTRSSTTAAQFGYLALNFGGTRTPFLQHINSPTATGVVNYTTPAGQVPEFGMMLPHMAQATRTIENDLDANNFGASVFTATQAGSIGMNAQDAATPANIGSYVLPDAVILRRFKGSSIHQASVSAMTAGTLSLNYTLADATVRKWVLLGWSGTQVVPTVWTTRRQFSW